MSDDVAVLTQPIDLSEISVVVGEADSRSAKEIDRQLGILGMKNVRTFRNIDRVRHTLATDEADLLLCGMSGQEHEARSIFRDVRQQEIGDNPFMVVMSMTRPKSKDDVRKTVDSGPDDLFMPPFDRQIFLTRINEIAWARKKFIALPSYVGPTRRNDVRPGEKTAEEFEVPNPVQAIGTGQSREELRRSIAESASALDLKKFDGDLSLIKTLVEELLPDYEDSNITDEFNRRIGLVDTLLVGVAHRARRVGYDNLHGLCEMACNVVIDIKENPIPPNTKHLLVMPKLIEAFDLAIKMAPDKVGAA